MTAAAAPALARGGKRVGAGRPPLATGRITRCYALTQAHLDIIELCRTTRGFKSASEALRHLIEESSSESGRRAP